MEATTLNTVLVIGIGLFTGLLAWVFVDSRGAIYNKIKDNKAESDKENEELKRKLELTDAHLREFENVKFQEIMTALNGLITDVAVIKSELINIQKNK